jgi:hypothetical protein
MMTFNVEVTRLEKLSSRDGYMADVAIAGVEEIPGLSIHRRRNGWHLSPLRVGTRDGQPLRVSFGPILRDAIGTAIVGAIAKLERGEHGAT